MLSLRKNLLLSSSSILLIHHQTLSFTHAMLRKPFRGRRIKQEIQKWTAVRTPPRNLNPVRESPGSPIRPTPLSLLSPLPPLFFYCQNFPPTSHFRFTHQSLSTSSLATGTYYSRAPEHEPNTHLEDPNLNVESLRESSNDRRENSGDGEGFCRRRTLPEERVSIFTCVRENGKCRVFCFWTKHNSQELSREEAIVITYAGRNVASWELLPCDLGSIERLKRNREVVNMLEVYPGDMCHVAMEEIMKYGGKVMPLPKQVANKLEACFGRRFRVAYEEAMKYGVQVALCDTIPLKAKILKMEDSLLGFEGGESEFISKIRALPSKGSRLWCLCVWQLLDWIQSWTGEMERD